MPLKMDKFTWGIVAVVALLLVAAFVSISMADGDRRGDTLTYVEEDSPAATVRNAYVAFLRNEPLEARRFYSADVLEEAEDTRAFPDRFGVYAPGDRTQRLRILDVDEDGGTAAVTIAVDHYSSGGPFNSGSTWTNQQVLPLVREDGAWKIDTLYLFY